MTEAELARRLGTTRAYVNKILQGATNFTIESLIKIGGALDCELSLEFTVRTKKEPHSTSDFIVIGDQSIDVPKVVRSARSNIRDFAEYKDLRTVTTEKRDDSKQEAKNAGSEIAA